MEIKNNLNTIIWFLEIDVQQQGEQVQHIHCTDGTHIHCTDGTHIHCTDGTQILWWVFRQANF